MELSLSVREPFDWQGIVEFLSRRAVGGLEVVSPDVYSRTAELDGARGSIAVRRVGEALVVGTADELGSDAALGRRVGDLFDLDAEVDAISGALGSDPLLGPGVSSSPGLRVPGAWDGFELAVRAVLGQQVTVQGAATLCKRLVESYGESVETGDGALNRLFPTAEALASADFAGVGLTRGRERTLQALARATLEGSVTLDRSQPHEEFVRSMTALPGIGDWTAQYVAMRVRHDADAFPASDLVLRKAVGGGEPVSTRELLERAEVWRPFRAYAAMHLWRSMA